MYRITPDEYDALYEEQNGECAICGTTQCADAREFPLHVDHNHRTDEVRGLLCDLCNRGIGNFNDDPELLRSAADYLERKHS